MKALAAAFAAVSLMLAAGSAQAAVIFQSLPSLAVEPWLFALCADCGGGGQQPGQPFSLTAPALATQISVVVHPVNNAFYTWPEPITFDIFQDGHGVVGAKVWSSTISSFLSEKPLPYVNQYGVKTEIVTVDLGSGVQLAPGDYILFYYNPFRMLVPMYMIDGVTSLVYTYDTPGGPVPGANYVSYSRWVPYTGVVLGVSISGPSSGPSAVPEPAAWASLILGLFGLGALLRRRGQRSANAA